MRNVEFVKSAAKKDQYPRSVLPRIAFVGRSNVGKSSLINCIVKRKGLAKTSSTPGRTQIINFFNVDDTWLFVDLPGYGYAKVPQRIRDTWAEMIEEFLLEDELKLVVLIVDARHEPTKLDCQMAEWMVHNQIPFQVVATKVDKVKKSKIAGNLSDLTGALKVESVLPFSAETGQGRKLLIQKFKEICS